jgi:dTDP-4-dehydrorhamnose reductase
MSIRAEGPVLLLGASGFFGSTLSEEFGSDAVGTFKNRSTPNCRYFDACRDSLAQLVSGLPHKPFACVMLFGDTKIDNCALDPIRTSGLNVSASIRLINESCELGITPIFISSDAVFDGHRSWWKEGDATDPVLTYGRQKLMVERHVAMLPGPWLIVRLPKLLAENRDARCMLTNWVDDLGRPGLMKCATDQYFTPASVNDVAKAVATLVRECAQGTFHIGGPQRLNRRELLEAVISEYRKSRQVRAEIIDCSLFDLPFREMRPLDTSLCSDRFARSHDYAFHGAETIAIAAVRSCLAE